MIDLESLALKYIAGKLLVLDQRRLPGEEKWVHCRSPEEMVEIIKTLQVRGAPLIGVAAALSLADFALGGASETAIRSAAEALVSARPTAVNLRHAMERMVLGRPDLSAASLWRTAEALFVEDRALCSAMANHGAALIKDGDGILTHCNTGGLVTTGSGTALGAIIAAWSAGRKIHVYVDETRPLLQGARLTAWELARAGVPHTLVCDSMAGVLMAQGRVNKVFVGADRIAANGDVANKVGTYSVAVLAHHHRLPFYVVAPYTTVDTTCKSGADIPIEERDGSEVRGDTAGGGGTALWAPQGTTVWNPAFDVTPASLVTAIVLDRGIFPRERLEAGALSGL